MKRLQTRITAGIGKVRLDDFLGEWLRNASGLIIPRRVVRQMIMSGAIYVNRHRALSLQTPLFPGAVIEVYSDEEKVKGLIQGKQVSSRKIDELDIIFEDDDLIAISKPAGIPSQPTVDGSRVNAYASLKELLSKRTQKHDYLGLHHRLDRDTSGVLLFTKNQELNKPIGDLFRDHQISKTYHAICLKLSDARSDLKLGNDIIIENYLSKVSEKKEKSHYGSVNSGGDLAITHFHVHSELKFGAVWLTAKPKTGRTHQIRVHASEMGFPILGDQTYFPKGVVSLATSKVAVPRLMLHAASLEFEHPRNGRLIKIEATFPDDYFKALTLLGGER